MTLRQSAADSQLRRRPAVVQRDLCQESRLCYRLISGLFAKHAEQGIVGASVGLRSVAQVRGRQGVRCSIVVLPSMTRATPVSWNISDRKQ